MHFVTTLGYILDNGWVLMMLRNKKKNDPNQDKWIGVGGKVEPNETIEQSLIREVKEETGLDVIELQYRGVVHFFSDTYASEDMHVFVIPKFSGTLQPCDEGTLAWMRFENLDDLPMWEGDQIFIQYIRNKHPFFNLTLHYKGQALKEALLDGVPLDITDLIQRKER